MRIGTRDFAALSTLVFLFLPVAEVAGATRSRNEIGSFADAGVGARELAMGMAVTAASMNATSTYWNPANLAFVTGAEITGSFTDLHNLGLARQGFIGLASPDRGGGGLSLLVTHLDFDSDGYTEFTLGYSAARRVVSKLAVGGTLRYLGARSTIDMADANGFALDLAATWKVHRRITVAGMARDAVSWIRWHGEDSERLIFRSILGVALEVAPNLLLTADGSITEESFLLRRLSLGAEVDLADVVALRAGLRRLDGSGDARLVSSFGAGVRHQALGIDYAAVLDDSNEGLGNSHRGSLTIRF